MNTENRETKSEALRDSQTADEGRRRQDAAAPDDSSKKPVQYPTWRYAKDGRTAIVNDPFELEQLEADGGDWQDTPHQAETQFVPGGLRTFAGPVGTVDAVGRAARFDRPTPEVGLTDPLPRNVARSVPQGEVETRRQQSASTTGESLSAPVSQRIARLEGRIQELEQENAKLRSKGGEKSSGKSSGKKAKGKSGGARSKKGKEDTDARVEARREAADASTRENAAAADAQSAALHGSSHR